MYPKRYIRIYKVYKVAKMLLLRKGDKPLENLLSYRIICLLKTLGKVIEWIIKTRFEIYLEKHNNLNKRQFGFREGRSTVNAISKYIKVIALNMANAFNTANWSRMEEALHTKKVPGYLIGIISSYLDSQSYSIEFGEEGARNITCGVPQGSVLISIRATSVEPYVQWVSQSDIGGNKASVFLT